MLMVIPVSQQLKKEKSKTEEHVQMQLHTEPMALWETFFRGAKPKKQKSRTHLGDERKILLKKKIVARNLRNVGCRFSNQSGQLSDLTPRPW